MGAPFASHPRVSAPPGGTWARVGDGAKSATRAGAGAGFGAHSRRGEITGTEACMHAGSAQGTWACGGTTGEAASMRARARSAAARASALLRWRASSVRPRRRLAEATMKLATSEDAAMEKKHPEPSAATAKQSGASVRRKLRAFLTKKALIRGEGTTGVIQKRQAAAGDRRASGDATMVWKLSTTESRNAAPGFLKTTRPGFPSQRPRSSAS